MNNPYTYAWKNINRGVFEYWQKVFGTVENLQGYPYRLFPSAIKRSNEFIWRVKIGGGNKVPRGSRSQITGGAWLMDATLETFCTTEDVAYELGGIVMDHEPVTESDVIGLQRFHAITQPDIELATLRVEGPTDAGQEILCVRMWVDFQCAFHNTEKKT